MTALGKMRESLVLMGEERVPLSGGRQVRLTPIIAMVYAAVETEAAPIAVADGRPVAARHIRATVHNMPGYAATRYLEWRARRYRVTASRETGSNRQFLELAATEAPD